MKRASIATVLTVAVLALLPGLGANAALAAGPSSLQMSIVPADAQWVMHLDMERFAASTLFQLLSESGKGFDLRTKMGQFSDKLKMDPLKDIMGVTVFGRGGAGQKPVVAVNGNFDKAGLLGILKMESSYKETPYGKHTLYSWEGAHYGAFVDDRLALLAEDETDIKSALDAIGGKTKNVSASPLVSLLRKGPQGAMIEFALGDINSLTGQAKDVGAAALPAMLTQMRSISGVVAETGDRLNMKIEIGAESAQVAQSIQQTIQGLVALMNLQFKEDAEPITRGFSVKTDGDRVRIDGSYLIPELTKIIKGRREHKTTEQDAPKQ